MLFRKLHFLKHFAWALIILLLLLSAAEIGLQFRHPATGSDIAPVCLATAGPVELSWSTFYELTPFQRTVTKDPDAQKQVVVRTNSLGIRGPEPIVPKPIGVYRIICLGDEHVFAETIPEYATFCAKLQEYLQSKTRLQIEVINAGVPGYCPLLSYLQVKHRLLGLQPDLIILNFDMGDIADDYRYRRYTRLDDMGIPAGCPHPVLEAQKSKPSNRLTDRSRLAAWCQQTLASAWKEKVHLQREQSIDGELGRYAWLEDQPPDWSLHIEQAFSAIGQLQSAARGVYARLVVATYPAPWQVSAEASAGDGVRERQGIPPGAIYHSRRPFEMIGQYAAQREITFFDSSMAFQQIHRPSRLFFENSAQMSALGHELYARLLTEFLEANIPGLWMNQPTVLGGMPAEKSMRPRRQ